MKTKVRESFESGSLEEMKLFSSIQILFRGDARLIYFLFHHQNRNLRRPPAELLKDARGLSSGERILIQTALDLWGGYGNVRLSAILKKLDHENFIAFIRALLRYREIDLEEVAAEEYGCYD